MRSTTAKMVSQRLLDLRVVRLRGFPEQSGNGNDYPWRAIAALGRGLGNESPLDGAQATFPGQSLDGNDVFVLELRRRRNTAQSTFPIH